MDELFEELPGEVNELQALLRSRVHHYERQLAEREAHIAQRDATIERLREQINVLLAKRYGASAERVSEAQLGLFNEAELEAEAPLEEAPATEVAAYGLHPRQA